MKNTISLKDKRVLVTGAAGVIGQELVALLVAEGAKIRAVDMFERPAAFDKDVEYFQCDLSSPEEQFAFHFEPEYVFHLAADFERSTENLDFWENNFYNNILVSHYTLRRAVQSKELKKIIFASSYLIYQKSLYSTVGRDNVLKESSPTEPRNLCGIAKFQTERDIEFLSEQMGSKFSYAHARIFRVYGRDSRDIVSRWVRGALRDETLKIFDKKNSFDYIHAADVAKGLLKIAENDEAQGVINLSFGESHSIAEVATLIQKEIPGAKFKEVNESIFPESSRGDIARLKETTLWSPEIPLAEGVKKIVSHEKSKIR